MPYGIPWTLEVKIHFRADFDLVGITGLFGTKYKNCAFLMKVKNTGVYGLP